MALALTVPHILQAGSRAQCYYVSVNPARLDKEVSRPYFPLLAEICAANGLPREGASPEKCAQNWRTLVRVPTFGMHRIIACIDFPANY